VRLLATALGGALFVLYPVAVWLALTRLEARSVGILMILVVVPAMVLRHRRAAGEDLRAALVVPLVVLAVLVVGVVVDDARYLMLTPVLISAGLLVTFAASLRPGAVPTIERFARMQDPELDPPRRAHCRQATWAWVAFFVLNGAFAAALAWRGDAFLWSAYTGGVAYALMGVLFVGEYVVRQARFRRYGRHPVDRLLSRLFPPR
jgi:uncharacterized membrane protein